MAPGVSGPICLWRIVAVRADDEALGHPVHSPIDGGAAGRVDADRGVRVAEGAEEPARVLRRRPCS